MAWHGMAWHGMAWHNLAQQTTVYHGVQHNTEQRKLYMSSILAPGTGCFALCVCGVRQEELLRSGSTASRSAVQRTPLPAATGAEEHDQALNDVAR